MTKTDTTITRSLPTDSLHGEALFLSAAETRDAVEIASNHVVVDDYIPDRVTEEPLPPLYNGRGQWVRDQLTKAFPKLAASLPWHLKGFPENGVKHTLERVPGVTLALPRLKDPSRMKPQWVDINGNGRKEGREVFKDFDEDGIVGNIRDFIEYYLLNKKVIDKKVPFFKMAESMDPGNMKIYNVIHDHLSLLSNMKSFSEIQAVSRLVASAITMSRKRATDRLPPRKRVANLFASYRNIGISYMLEAQISRTLADVPKDKGADCDDISILVQAAAHQNDLKLHLIPVPGHAFIRYDDGKTRFNYDVGVSKPNSFYKWGFDIAQTSIDQGVYLTNRTSYETLSDIYTAVALAEKSQRAKRYFKLAIYLNPNNVQAYHNLGARLFDEGKNEKALSVLNAALKLDPNIDHIYSLRSGIHIKAGRNTAALEDMDRAIKIKKRRMKIHHTPADIKSLANWLMVRGYLKKKLNKNGAEEDFTSACLLDKGVCSKVRLLR